MQFALGRNWVKVMKWGEEGVSEWALVNRLNVEWAVGRVAALCMYENKWGRLEKRI